jgi:hypothetical protein
MKVQAKRREMRKIQLKDGELAVVLLGLRRPSRG